MAIFHVSQPDYTEFQDGFFSGAAGDGGTHPPGRLTGFSPQSLRFWEVPAITPAVNEHPSPHDPPPILGKRIVYINGITTASKDHAHTIKLISVITGVKVSGVYNKTHGFLKDLGESTTGKLGFINPPTRTLRNSIFDACINKVYLNIVAHSQGGIITSAAARKAKKKITEHLLLPFSKLPPDEMLKAFSQKYPQLGVRPNANNRLLEITVAVDKLTEQLLNDYVSIQTFGSAGMTYPKGPLYRHVYNAWDTVPNTIGSGFFDPKRDLGLNSNKEQLHRNSGNFLPNLSADHSIDDVYLQNSNDYVNFRGKKVDSNYIPIHMNMVR